MLKKNTETFIGCDAEYGEADYVLFGAPYDCTASLSARRAFRKPCRPGGILRVRNLQPVIRNRIYPVLRCSISAISSFPSGIPPGAFHDRSIRGPRFKRRKASRDARRGASGDAGGPSRRRCEISGLHILHFDAHADLRDDYLGQKLSHATVLRRAWELVGDRKIHQFGIRSGDR